MWIWDTGAHTIHSATKRSLCLDIPDGDTSAGYIQLSECDSNFGQMFDWDSASGGIFHFLTKDFTLCLDLPDDQEQAGSQLQFNECMDRVQQSWDLVPVEPIPAPSPTPPSPTPPSPGGCPGGSQVECMKTCPTDTWSTCVKACSDNCPNNVAVV